MRPKAQPPRLPEAQAMACNKNPHQTAVRLVVFADARRRICRPERMLAAHDDVAIWRDGKIERTELRIFHLP